MNTITVTLPDELRQELHSLASRLNLSIEELVLMGIENLILQSSASSNNITKSEVSDKFNALAAQWQDEVEGLSSTTQMSRHPAYQEIIKLGTPVIPLLLEDLKKNPLCWLNALQEITGINPVKPEQRGRIKQMAEAWLDWGKNQGYIV